MGCDIHICIQRQDEGGTWIEIPYYDSYDAPNEVGVKAPDCFTARNYDLFGILADVRNGSGVAGCMTGEGWPSIAPNRGWPKDFDPEAVAPYPNYPENGPRFMGDHSATWVTLEELKAFPWDVTTSTLYGVVPADEHERLYAAQQAPTSYRADISGLGIRVYDRTTYLEAKRMNRLASRPYVRMSWQETARQATNDWAGQVIPWLETLAAGRPLRLVMGFDS